MSKMKTNRGAAKRFRRLIMGNTIKILVIGDDDTVQSIIGMFIENHMKDSGITDFLIKRVTDPVQGLFLLNTQGSEYRAILLDVRLPKLTGDEIYNSLIAVESEFLERVMFVTSHPYDLIQRFPDRPLNILEKPFHYEELSEKLGTMLAS
jgi:two-component system LytT family response regulator